MNRAPKRSKQQLPAPDFFDLAGSDPELLKSGRIPDPLPGHTPLFRGLARVLQFVESRLRARGDTVLRNAIRFFWGFVALVGIFLLVGPIVNEPLDFEDVIASAEIDDVDWIARDAEIDYVIDRDSDGGFVAQVSERFAADFRNGSEPSVARTILTEYHGHDVRFELMSATIAGAEAEIDVRPAPTTTEVRLAPVDGEPLSGTQEIALTYELHDLVTSDVDDATGRTVDSFDWPLFAPTWPQATKGIEVSLTLAPEIDDELVRSPRAYIGWLLISGTEWLSAEGESAAGVRYAFSNDDALPPNADLFVSATFEPGTFTQPQTTSLFWVQTYGPLIPMALLLVLTLFAFAARRVVWADSAGNPWYLPRHEPPENLSPMLAAELMGKRRHVELVDELERVPKRSSSRREAWLRRLARAGRRAGTVGNTPTVLRRTRSWGASNAAVRAGLRWVPDSYVRDFFTIAPIAIMLLQWGLLRQLSHQVILAVVWWPAAFVLVSTALAIISNIAVSRPRPLTRAGALAMQELKGIDVWARGTRLLDRGPLEDPLLPYALLFERPRRAGRKIAEHAAEQTGDRAAAHGWRTEHFVSAPAVLALFGAVAVLAGSIVTVSTQPAPYATDTEFVTWSNDLPGTLYTEVSGFDIEAELRRGDDGGARLDVIERLDVVFDDSASKVPQFAKEWPTERLGQSLGFELRSVTVDGEAAPYTELPQPRTNSLAMLTQFSDVLAGEHEVEIAYTLHSAAVDAPGVLDADQQVRWAAWLSHWEDEYYAEPGDYFGAKLPVRPLRVELTVAPDLVDELTDAGWIDSDSDRPRMPLERGNVTKPWVTEQSFYTDEAELEDRTHYELRIGSERERADGALVVEIDADRVESRKAEDYSTGAPAEDWTIDADINGSLDQHSLDLNGDLGALVNFSPGTFDDVEAGAFDRYERETSLPFTALFALLGVVVAVSIGVIVCAARVRRAASTSLRVTAWLTVPLIALAQCVLFCWVVLPMPGSDVRGGGAIALGAVMFTAVIAQGVMVARRTGSSTRKKGQWRA